MGRGWRLETWREAVAAAAKSFQALGGAAELLCQGPAQPYEPHGIPARRLSEHS